MGNAAHAVSTSVLSVQLNATALLISAVFDGMSR